VRRLYLKKCKQHVFLELVELSENVWVILGFVLIVDLYVRGVDATYTSLPFEIETCVVERYVCAV
jgi:hypothetical protein